MTDWDADGADEADEPRERNAHSIPTSYPCTRVLLTLAQETDLCDRSQAGDDAARQQMMEGNIRLVMSIAGRYRARSMVFEDLVQEGILGLFEAIKRFDGRRGYRFSTYASYWIRQSINRSIERFDRIIRLPAGGVAAERRIYDTEQELHDELGRAPTVEEVAARTGVSRAIVSAFLFYSTDPLSLDGMIGEQESTPLVEFIPDDGAVDPEDNSLQRALGDELRETIRELPPRERLVIERRFGFYDGHLWTLNMLAQELDMSREGVRHVETRGLKRLRALLRGSASFAARWSSSA